MTKKAYVTSIIIRQNCGAAKFNDSTSKHGCDYRFPGENSILDNSIIQNCLDPVSEPNYKSQSNITPENLKETNFTPFDKDLIPFESSFSTNFDDELIEGLLNLSLEPSPVLLYSPKSILRTSSKIFSMNTTAAKHISFNCKVMVSETYSEEDYQRKGDYVAKVLTPELAFMIKNELNTFKAEMEIHEESRQFTQFYNM